MEKCQKIERFAQGQTTTWAQSRSADCLHKLIPDKAVLTYKGVLPKWHCSNEASPALRTERQECWWQDIKLGLNLPQCYAVIAPSSVKRARPPS